VETQVTDKVSVVFLHPGEVKTTFFESFTRMLINDIYGAGRIISHNHGMIGKRCSAGGLVDGRNGGTRQMLESEADWLLFIDADMVFGQTLLEDLLAAADPDERPVVGALCFATRKDRAGPLGVTRFKCEPTMYRAPDLAVMDEYPDNEMVRVGATGGACLLIHRSALETVREEFGDHWFDPVPITVGGFFSEDLSFCIRLDKLEIPLYVHTGIKTAHDKGFVFYDEETYLRQRTEAV
jgi:GT2 family glycosyltransferase